MSVCMDGCESWTIKKAERWRIDSFELWCRRRLLRVPWTARRSNQFILKEISPEYSLKWLMLKLKFQYFGHLWRAYLLGKTLMLGKFEDSSRRGQQKMIWLKVKVNLVPLGRVLELSFLWTPFFPEFLFLFFFLLFPFFLFLPFFLSFFLLSFLLCFFLKGWDWPDHAKAVGPNVELLETKRP